MRKTRLLLLLALLLTAATGAWGMQIYISYPSWPTGTNVNGDGNLVLEMEASDSFENMKAKIEDKSGLNPDYMKLYFNSVEMANNETLDDKGVTKNSVLTLVYTLYTVTFAEGTDPNEWTASPNAGVTKGQTVTVTYTGSKKVIGVKAEKKAAAPDPITVTWNINDITYSGSDNSFTKDGVTITAGSIDFDEKNFAGGGTFTTTLGNFTKIEVTKGTSNASGTGWSGSGRTWTGNDSSVQFSNEILGMGMDNFKIVFTIVPTN